MKILLPVVAGWLLLLGGPRDDSMPKTWLFGNGAGNSDRVLEALRMGDFQVPEPGSKVYGIQWKEGKLRDNGELPVKGFRGRLYAVAKWTVEEDTGMILRADSAFRVFINGWPQPGDVYHQKKLRIPIHLRKGENVIVAGFQYRGKPPVLHMTKTGDEIAFNTADMTFPHLRLRQSEPLHLGVPVLNMTGKMIFDVRARVLENDYFEASESTHPSLSPNSVTPLPFLLKPALSFSEPGQKIPVTISIESDSLKQAYTTEVSLETVAADDRYRRTFLSDIDRSVQYYAVTPPTDFSPDKKYGLVLSLHGAAVEAWNQSRAYSPHDWCYIVSATNRRPFGFDWEDWGRLDALEVLDHAVSSFNIDPERIYLTGHSMGGHGTWNVGVLHTDRFATLGPSAGWSSFDSYGGARTPKGKGVREAFRRAAVGSQTLDYIGNLKDRGVYIIHGAKDNNVPVSQGRMMNKAVGGVSEDVQFHIEEGAKHWWDKNKERKGADCVDWPPLFEFMKARKREPVDLDFTFTTPSPWISPKYSYITVLSAKDPYSNCVIESTRNNETVTLNLTNVRSCRLEGTALRANGITSVIVGGEEREVPDGALHIGPETGKHPLVHGPIKEVFYRPFLYVVPDGGSDKYQKTASRLITDWAPGRKQLREQRRHVRIPGRKAPVRMAHRHSRKRTHSGKLQPVPVRRRSPGLHDLEGEHVQRLYCGIFRQRMEV
jgi:pimeloyl-ACP methyl ester carboxylesterase